MKKSRESYKQKCGLLNKMALLAITAGVVAFGAGCGNSAMDRKEALEFALADAELTAGDITVTGQEMEQKDGKTYYKIAFTSGEYAYYYEIDAFSGAVTGVSINAVSAGGSQTEQSENAQGDGNGTQPGGEQGQGDRSGNQPGGEQGQGDGSGNQPGGEQGQGDGSGNQPGGEQPCGDGNGNQPAWGEGQPGQVGTMDSAKAIALADAGLTEAEVTFTKEKLDWDNGLAVYDIEFYTADREYEYEINAATGAIMERNGEAFQNPGNYSGGTDSLIGEDKAKETAAAHAGFSTAEVFFTKVKLEEEYGRMEYEIEFYKDRVEYEVTIDAVSGTVLEYESEYDD